MACAASRAAAQTGMTPSTPVKPESVTVAAGERYQAGALHRWFSGGTYRDLWATPIRVPLLDWQTYLGGLHPTKEGGGMQTKSLRLETTNGSEYVFRLADKIATGAPGSLKHTPVDRFFQDEVSAEHPAAAEISAPILEATGVLHPTATLVVMPDDPMLGKYRADFAGRLGMIEEYPNVPKESRGFAGATKIIDSEELLRLMNADAKEHVDARAFLAARLTDFLINDNDRHSGNGNGRDWNRDRRPNGSRSRATATTRSCRTMACCSRLAAMVRSSLVSARQRAERRRAHAAERIRRATAGGLEKPVWDSVALAIQATRHGRGHRLGGAGDARRVFGVRSEAQGSAHQTARRVAEGRG